MRTECLIWDWNGTLLDDVALCNDCLNQLLEAHGYPQRYDRAAWPAPLPPASPRPLRRRGPPACGR